MIRVVLPAHLRTLARVERRGARSRSTGRRRSAPVLDALEARYPMLRGTIRDHGTRSGAPFVRFFACEEDLSHDRPTTPLPRRRRAGASRSWWSARWPAAEIRERGDCGVNG